MIGAGFGWLSAIAATLGIILFMISCLKAADHLMNDHDGGNEKR